LSASVLVITQLVRFDDIISFLKSLQQIDFCFLNWTNFRIGAGLAAFALNWTILFSLTFHHIERLATVHTTNNRYIVSILYGNSLALFVNCTCCSYIQGTVTRKDITLTVPWILVLDLGNKSITKQYR